MGAYILRRLLLMIPTIVGIMAISFAVIQFAPGGPVEQVIAQLTGEGDSAIDRIAGGGDTIGSAQQDFGDSVSSQYRGAQGLDPEFIAKLEATESTDKRNVALGKTNLQQGFMWAIRGVAQPTTF